MDTTLEKKNGSKAARMEDASLIQCHFISNTHWDREWRDSAQRTRYALVEMLDMLFDIFEKEPNFRTFHLDSQTLPVQEYLEVRPEMEPRLRQAIQEKKLVVGPWFCLPDEFSVSGESLVRNLLLGHRIARRYGEPSKTGYSPFGWGQISQMPQIYKGFGITCASFYRGINSLATPRSEFVWEAPDGTRIFASRLSKRPRYNVWYIIHRRIYQGLENCNERKLSWLRGGAPFRLIDKQYAELDYLYAHPSFKYETRYIEEACRQAIEEQDADWTTPHRFWSEGHDSSGPDPREVRMIEDCNRALEGKARVFHSTVAEWEEGVCRHFNEDWPVAKGEMRYLNYKGSSSGLYGWVISARTYIKQENFRTERDLQVYAEPMSVFAALLGAEFPQSLVNIAYNWLLQNHGHDSIGGCSKDVIHDDMMFRYRQAREISCCLMERAMMRLAGAIDTSELAPEEVMVMAYNPTAALRTQVAAVSLNMPAEVPFTHLRLVDEQGCALESDIISIRPYNQFAQSLNDCANEIPARRVEMRVKFEDVPGMGYRAFRVMPEVRESINKPFASLRKGLQGMENEHLAVEVQANGALTITDKATGRGFADQGIFTDAGEIGNPWEHFAPINDVIFTTKSLPARVSLIHDTAMEIAFRVELDWALPEGRSQDEQTRSPHMKPYRIVNTVTLRKGQRWVEVQTEVDNTVEDHILRVLFPSRIKSDVVHVQGQFDVVARPIPRPDMSEYCEPFMSDYPMNSFVDISDGEAGLALLNEGLKAYEAMDDAERTISLTLLRGYPMRICVTQSMTDYSKDNPGSQCLGRQQFRYSIMPHAGNWETGGVWAASEAHNYDLRLAQIGPHSRGKLPWSGSFLEVSPSTLHVSAVKLSESGEGWVVRLFNPSDAPVQARVRLNMGFAESQEKLSPVESLKAEHELAGLSERRWKTVRQVTLEEKPVSDLALEADGSVELTITGKRIETLEFLG